MNSIHYFIVMMMERKLTHVDSSGRAKMVDVGGKPVTARLAVAEGFITLAAETIKLIRDHSLHKGDVLQVARIAGIQAAKKTHDLIPLCHPLPLTHIDVELELKDTGVTITATVKCEGRTGVEMEALTACSVAALTVYDMCKAVDRSMEIRSIRLVRKEGGQSGTFIRETS